MRIQVGSLVIEDGEGRNIVLFKSHTPSQRFMIENADIDDFIELAKKLKKARGWKLW